MLGKLLAAAGLGMLLAQPLAAQNYPDRPVRLLVGFGAGGPTDQAARIVAEAMAQSLGQPVVVENMPGAGSAIAARALLAAPADGYTLIVGTSGFPVAEARYSNNEYAMGSDFDYVGTIAGYPQLLVVGPNSPHEDLRSFLDAAGAAPAPPMIGINSNAQELLTLYLGQQSGVDLEYIPYGGQAAVSTDLLGSRIDAAFLAPAVAQSFIASGDMRALAASSAERFSLMPEVATFEEQGLEGFESLIWNGLLVRSGTDPEIVEQLAAALRGALEDEQVIARLETAGLEPMLNSPEEFRAKTLAELQNWGEVMEAAGLEQIEQ